MSNSASVTGYVIDGETFCVDCADLSLDGGEDPIFAGSEWDDAPCCAECDDEIEVCALNEGEDRDLEKDGFEDITDQEIPDEEEIPEAEEDEIEEEDDLDAMDAEVLEE